MSVVKSPFAPDLVGRYTGALCYDLALAVARLTGWAVCGVTEDTERQREWAGTGRQTVEHAMVRTPCGLLLDAVGLRGDATVLAVYQRTDRKGRFWPYSILPTTVDNLERHVRWQRSDPWFLRSIAPDDAAIARDAEELLAWALPRLGIPPDGPAEDDRPGGGPRP